MDEEEAAIWPTYNWCNNPWITDANGKVLDDQKYGIIKRCALNDLQIQRTSAIRYTLVIPWVGTRSYSQVKLRLRAVTIVCSAPSLEVGDAVENGSMLRMKN
ncbi:hypothetical protein PHMEG_00028198 [Phytophthora megakarya]|uniref:Uncharacterized protein n=1 Tax=Phytophthora megakarya TaxID=4795 RepID=A0A225V755_9STRA|nr:hypothetical protein PHMEG_00028198 [Phytophthora megakarya]